MRLVVITETKPFTVSFNFMWAPTFIGLDNSLKKELEERIGPELVGKEVSDKVLDEAHDKIVAFIVEKYSAIEGLRDYLDAIKFIQER
jgi:hypothetical protein